MFGLFPQTGENWVDIMVTGIRARGPATVIYFIAIIVIGTYLVLNLYVAIMLTAFQVLTLTVQISHKCPP